MLVGFVLFVVSIEKMNGWSFENRERTLKEPESLIFNPLFL